MGRLAVIDYDPEVCALIRALLEEHGWEVLVHPDAETVLPVLHAWRPEVVLLDLWLTGSDRGWELLQHLQADALLRSLPVVICSADTRSLDTHAAWFADHHIPVIEKPFDLGVLEDTVERMADVVQPRVTA